MSDYDLSARKVTLPDGRELAVSEFGDPSGQPLFFFHGWPGARLQGVTCHEAGQKLGIRVIAVDRPGFGQSDFQAKRQILDWPDDIAHLADSLSIQQYKVLGLSGGGPYALACAYKTPERIAGTAVVCGVGPSDNEEELSGFMEQHQKMIRVIRKAPWLVHFLFWRNVRHQNKHPQETMAEFLADLPAPDKAALSTVEADDLLKKARNDSLSPGIQGHVWEMRLFARPWQFCQQAVSFPVQLWYAAEDSVISPAVGQRANAKLPNSQLHLVPDEGHYSLLINQAETILTSIA